MSECRILRSRKLKLAGPVTVRPVDPLDLPNVIEKPAALAAERKGRVERPARTKLAARRRRSAPALTLHVIEIMDRLEEAYTVLARLPMTTRPKTFGSAMPAYTYEQSDLIAQVETGELERLLADRNRFQLRGATSAEIARMEEALLWPMEFLIDRPELARSVGLNAMWAVYKLDPRKQCRRLGIDPKAHRERWLAGVEIISEALHRLR